MKNFIGDIKNNIVFIPYAGVTFSWDEYTDEQGSPSPVIYPERPPKGRKSLASVELPNFRTGKEK